MHWQNQFLLLFKIYWNLTHRSNTAVAVAADDDVNCAALLLLCFVSSLPQFINSSDFSRSVKQSVLSLQLGLGSGFACAAMVQRFTNMA